MQIKKYSVFLLCLFSGLILVFAACPKADAQQGNGNTEFHNANGMKYFNKGYYEFIPKNKKKEATQNLNLAVVEFKKAIAQNENFINAHRNLARVYSVQKNYHHAAEQYRKVTDLNPLDLDAYVLAALQYLELGKYNKALERLETAKTYTDDQTILDTMNGYIEKVVQEKMAN